MPHPRARRSMLVLIFAVAAIAFPLGVLANHQFTDVPTGASYHDDVEALVNAGITTGCGASTYCPGNPVTRGQMAQFLNRIGNLDGTSTPSVDADAVDGIDSSGFLQAGTIVTLVDGSAWDPHFIAPSIVNRFVTITQFSGDGAAVLPLVAPAQVGTTSYGLASLEICFTTNNGSIDYLEIARTTAAGIAEVAFSDSTDRAIGECFTVTPSIAVGKGLGLFVEMAGGSDTFVSLGVVKSTWSSVGTFD